MRILQLVHTLKTGGAEILADRIGRHFASQHEVIFACLDEVGEIGEKLISSGFQVELLQRGHGVNVGCMKRLRDVISKHRIELIHAHQYTPFFYASAARKLRRSPRIMFTEHGRFYPDHPSIKRGIYNRLAIRRNDSVVAVGMNVKDALVKNEYIKPAAISVIYNGIDIERFANSNQPDIATKTRSNLNIPEQEYLLIQVARLDYLKDHITAVRAIAKLKHHNVTLLIVGDGPERGAIENEITNLNLASKIRLLGLRDDIPHLLSASDGMLLTSISEGIPLTLLEGMACQLPIVSTAVGGIHELITDGHNGLLATAQEPTEIAEAIKSLILDRGRAKQLGLQGYEIAKDRFTEKQMLSAYDQKLTELLPI